MKDMPTDQDQVSLRGRRWKLAGFPRGVAERLEAKGINRSAARILASRDVTPETLEDFLNPMLKNLMPDPFFFLDMEKAVQRVAKAVMDRQRIGIWSDYDADGATSAAVLGRFLRGLGHEDFVVRIPDRLTEGYGPNTPGLLDMRDRQGCNLICILDAGIVAFEPLAAAKAAGIEVVVLDHHMAEDTVPEAVAVVNPNRKDQEPGYGHLCAAGVTFIFAVGVTRELRKLGWFAQGKPVPDLMGLLDIVALGTVCDVVALKGLNRAFVYQGLKVANSKMTPGIRELAEVAGLDLAGGLNETHFGWQIGPRINAGGRIASSLLGAEILLEDDDRIAKERAQALDAINTERKEIEKAVTEVAMAKLADRIPGTTRTLALAVVENAHEGVVGISAGRVREAFDAPAIVVTHDHEGNLKGSARSVPGFDIGHAIIAARKAGLIVKGGGHGAAGGLTLRPDQLEGFIAFMNADIATTAYHEDGVHSEADLELSLHELDVKAIESFDVMRPFGQANPEPRIILKHARLADIRIMKDVHMKLNLEDGRVKVDVLAWNMVGTPLGDRIMAARGELVDVLGKPGINEWNGRKSVQMIMDDIRVLAD
ncbi:single-stranded-DNA-specific exonuclease RecJ [Paracoccus litorisediminis]|uniref:single-stranded-DNA-specific exonuclease RecJ n=1 Tax=Paracoccus litorisediminis TaxID=2006130 RepID=UPI0037311A18